MIDSGPWLGRERPGPPTQPMPLSRKQRAAVEAAIRPGKTELRVARRAQALLRMADVVSTYDTAKLVGDVVEHWHRLAQRARTVVFATGVAHSVHLRDEFRRSGVMAELLDGSTAIEVRDAILARLARGEVDVVC